MAHPITPLFVLLPAVLVAACGHAPPVERSGSARASEPSPATATPAPAADAPERYTVQRGDTLWDVAERFFDDPWRWPGIWGYNDHIENPHLIFPGDTLVLRNGRLEVERGLPVERLSPQVRKESLPTPIPVVDPERIEPFLRHAGLVGETEWGEAPRVLATEDDRLMVGTPGKEVFVRGGAPAGEVRLAARGEAITEPESGRTLAHWLQPVARGRRVAQGDPATVVLEQVGRPVRGGERVLAMAEPEVPRKLRAAPAGSAMEVIALPDRLANAGTHDTVVLHGARSRRGEIYRLHRHGGSVVDAETGEAVALPKRPIAWAVVYRTEGDLALALLVRAEEAVELGDRALAPS